MIKSHDRDLCNLLSSFVEIPTSVSKRKAIFKKINRKYLMIDSTNHIILTA